MTKNHHPFEMDFNKIMSDYQKMMGDFKVPGLDMEKLMSAQQKNIEAISSANKLAVENAQQVFQRQQEIMRGSMEEFLAMSKDMMSQGAPDQKIAKQTELFKETMDKAMANMKEIAELMAKSNADIANVLNARMTETMEEFKSASAVK